MVTITREQAARIAGEWHGGQAGALYAFVSTGAIGPDLLSEIIRLIPEAERQGCPEEMEQLREFIAAAGERGPQERWSFEWNTYAKNPAGVRAGIEYGMARCFFGIAYADQAEECGQALRGEIMEQVPEETDPAALEAARTLLYDMEQANKQYIEDMYTAHPGGLVPWEWGHYAAMQAMGQGVGLWNYAEAFGPWAGTLKVPSLEFGSYSLEKDYFARAVPDCPECETNDAVEKDADGFRCTGCGKSFFDEG